MQHTWNNEEPSQTWNASDAPAVVVIVIDIEIEIEKDQDKHKAQNEPCARLQNCQLLRCKAADAAEVPKLLTC